MSLNRSPENLWANEKNVIKSVSTCNSEKFGQGFLYCNRFNRIFSENVLIWSLKSEKLKKSVKNWQPFLNWPLGKKFIITNQLRIPCFPCVNRISLKSKKHLKIGKIQQENGHPENKIVITIDLGTLFLLLKHLSCS